MMKFILISIIIYLIYKEAREFFFPEEWQEKVYNKTVKDVNFNKVNK